MAGVNKGYVIPRDAILEKLWQRGEVVDENTFNVHIVRMRMKLSEMGVSVYLETKRGKGTKYETDRLYNWPPFFCCNVFGSCWFFYGGSLVSGIVFLDFLFISK